MRISEAISMSKDALAWRPYYDDIQRMEETDAKVIYASGEAGEFTVHYFDTCELICMLQLEDVRKVCRQDDWRPVNPIPELWEKYLAQDAIEEYAYSTVWEAMDEFRRTLLPLPHPDISWIFTPFHYSDSVSGEWLGLSRKPMAGDVVCFPVGETSDRKFLKKPAKCKPYKRKKKKPSAEEFWR